MWRVLSAVPVRVEITSEFMEIKGDPVRLVGERGGLDEARIKREPPHQRKLAGILKPLERRGRERSRACRAGDRQVGNDLARFAKDRVRAGMAVLHVEHRII